MPFLHKLHQFTRNRLFVNYTNLPKADKIREICVLFIFSEFELQFMGMF